MKENHARESDTIGRLDSKGHHQSWVEGMRAMQDETSQVERNTPSDQGESQNISLNTVRWFVWAAACGYLAFAFYQLYANDEIRLHTLHSTTRILQTIARLCGMWALEFEQAYNDFVNTLH